MTFHINWEFPSIPTSTEDFHIFQRGFGSPHQPENHHQPSSTIINPVAIPSDEPYLHRRSATTRRLRRVRRLAGLAWQVLVVAQG